MAQRFVRQTSLVLSLLVVSCTATLLLCLLMEHLEKPNYRRPPVALHQDQPLLNMTNFHLLSSPYACHPEEEVKAIMVLARLKVRRVFLLAIPRKDQKGYNYASQKEVLDEAADHLDIVQGNFLEDYHNLTYKHAMGLRWAVQFCPQAQMLIKLDDDIAVDLPRLLAIVPPLLNKGNMLGYVLDGMTPERLATKWRVSPKDWPRTHYPRFLSGWLYVTTPFVASKLLSSLGTDFFWIDDVFITGVGSQRAKVPLIDLSPHFALNTESIRCCQQGRGCDFVVAPSGGDWVLLEEYLRLTRTAAAHRRGRGDCVVTNDPNQQPIGQGRGQVRAVGL